MSFLRSHRHGGGDGNAAAVSKKLSSERAQSEKSMVGVDGNGKGSAAADSCPPRTMEGFLWVRGGHARRHRYCVLQGRTLHVYNTKEEAALASPAAATAADSKKNIVVVGVKDAVDLDKSTRSQLLGGDVSDSALENALVISTTKSKLVAVEAETQTEKQRWLHAMSCLNFASATTERSFFMSLLQDKDSFDAHTAVTLLHRYRDNAVATELVIDQLAEYAEHHIDDVEFYIQQIMHLVVNVEMTKTEKLVHLLLSISKAKTYVEHLGNCIHLALQLFWLLEAKIQDKDPKTYNLCAKLLMSIEANVVNQQFEVSAEAAASPDAVATMLLRIPGMQERLVEMKKQQQQATTTKISGARPAEQPTTPRGSRDDSGDVSSIGSSPQGESVAVLSLEEDVKLQRELLMQWMEKERQKRYKYFHDQRDFVKALTDISEKMRQIEPPTERKKHLPAELKTLHVPAMAYIPLGRVSDPYARITRVLCEEGTVFSTHSRAPCLLCFEVVQDHVNAAGQRASFSKQPSTGWSASSSSSSSRRISTSARSGYSPSPMHATRGSTTSLSVSSSQGGGASCCGGVDEETEITGYMKKFSMKGKWIVVDDDKQKPSVDDSGENEEEAEDGDGDVEVEQVAATTHQDSEAEHATLLALERHLNFSATTNNGAVVNDGKERESKKQTSTTSIDTTSSKDGAKSTTTTTDGGGDGQQDEDHHTLIRHNSRTAYEYSLSKLMSEGNSFGERWREKKERIRASSPYGKLPGWNVISLISKSNDDIRQEVFAMQLISKFQDIFHESNLPLWLRPYRIISTGKTSGLIETLTDAQSLDSLKKKPGYHSLRTHFERTYGNGDVNSKPFKTAQRNFLHSLAAYSIVCYLLQIKDRHNGNIMLDTEGRLIHIDFGFMLGIAPGGNWSMEMMAPFKLTKEMVHVLGGVDSKMFGEFVHLFTRGLLAAQRQAEKIITLVEIMMRNSTFPCFQGRDVSKDLQKLRDRFLLHSTTEQTVKSVMKLVGASYKNKWTKRYDQFQKLTNGIIP